MDSLEELEKVYKYLEKKDNIDEKMLIKLQNVQKWICYCVHCNKNDFA